MLKKYNMLSLPMKAAFWFIICTFIQKAFAMLTTPIFTRLMSTEEYGEYSAFVSVTSILTVIITLNISSVLATKGINKYSKDKEQFCYNIQLLSTCSVMLFMFLFFFQKERICNFLKLDETIFYFAFGEMLVVPAFEIWAAKQRYEYKYKKILFFTIIFVLINTIVGISAVLLFEDKARGRIISHCIVLIVMYGLLYVSNLRIKKKAVNREMVHFALKFNLPLIPQGLANQILSRSDVFMIQYIQGSAYAGIYSLGYNLATLITIVTTSINNTYVPWLYNNLDSRNFDEIRTKSVYMLAGIFSIVTMIMLIAPEAVWFFAPKEYETAASVIAPVAVGIAFTMVYTLFVNLELYCEKTLCVMVGSVCVAIVNIILNSYFIPQFGFVAAAYTTLFSYIMYSIVHYFLADKICRDRFHVCEIYDAKKIVIISIIQIAILLAIINLFSFPIVRYAMLFLMALISTVIIYRRVN